MAILITNLGEVEDHQSNIFEHMDGSLYVNLSQKLLIYNQFRVLLNLL